MSASCCSGGGRGQSGWQEGTAKITGQGGRVEWTKVHFRSTRAGTESSSGIGTSWDASVSPSRLGGRQASRLTATLKRDWVRPDGDVKLTGQVAPGLSAVSE